MTIDIWIKPFKPPFAPKLSRKLKIIKNNEEENKKLLSWFNKLLNKKIIKVEINIVDVRWSRIKLLSSQKAAAKKSEIDESPRGEKIFDNPITIFSALIQFW